MAENLGGIFWTADVDTQGVISSDAQIKKASKNVEQSYTRMDEAARRANMNMTKSAAGVNKSFKSMKGAAQQFGFQIQDIAVQAQMGTNALTILGQQGGQIASIFGPGGAMIGAVIAISAALGTALLPSLFDSTDAVEELTEKLKELVKASALTKEQAAVLSNQEKDSIKEKEKQIKAIEEEIKVKKAALSNIEMTIGKYGEESKTYKTLAKARTDNSKELNTLVARQQVLNSEITKSNNNIATYNSLIDESGGKELGGTEGIEKAKEFAKDLSGQLEIAKLELEGNKLGAMELAAAFQLGLTNAEKLPDAVRDNIKALYEVRKEMEINAELDRMFEQEKIDAIRNSAKADIKASELRQKRISSLEQEIQLQGIKNSLGNEEYEIRAAILTLGDDATSAEVSRITALVQQMQALRREAEIIGPALKQSFGDIGVSALDRFSNSIASAVIEGQSLDDALKGIARSILTDLLAAVIRYWAGQAAAAIFGLSTVTGIAGTAAATSTAAWAPAATLASIATLGGAAGIGTAAVAGALAAGTALGIGSSVVGGGAGIAMGAGKLNGGPVNPGMMYPVTEDGRPELLLQGGRQYLLPGSKGEVVSNRDMRSTDNSSVSVSMPVTVYGNPFTNNQLRDALFQQEDVIYEIVQQAKYRRGEA